MSKGLSLFYRLVSIVGLSLILLFIIQYRFTGVHSLETPALILEGIDKNLVFFDNNLYSAPHGLRVSWNTENLSKKETLKRVENLKELKLLLDSPSF